MQLIYLKLISCQNSFISKFISLVILCMITVWPVVLDAMGALSVVSKVSSIAIELTFAPPQINKR